jgi:CRP-like cAMP-binding protein
VGSIFSEYEIMLDPSLPFRAALALEQIPLFAELSTEAVELLAAQVREFEHPQGAIVGGVDMVGEYLGIVSTGRLELVMALGKPGENVFGTIEQHEIFGEMCILTPVTRYASVRAAEITNLMAVPRAAFEKLSHDLPAQYRILLLNLTRSFARRLRERGQAFAKKAAPLNTSLD